MPNPFENEDAAYFVLVNEEAQYSLWPQFAAIPPGWRSDFGPDSHTSCLEYVEKVWIDMRPRSLVEADKLAQRARSL